MVSTSSPCFILDYDTVYVSTDLTEIRCVFDRFLRVLYFTNKVIKYLNLAGVGFPVQFINQNTVNKFMHILIGQFFYLRISLYQLDEFLYIRVMLFGCLYLPV